jgi:cytochrome c
MSLENRLRWRVVSCRGVVLALAMLLAGAAPVGHDVGHEVGHGGPIRGLSAWGGKVVSASFDGSAVVWPEGLVLRGHAGAVNAVAFMDDGRVVTGGADGRVLIWCDGAVLAERLGHTAPVAGLAVRDGLIASASWDGTARVWSPGGSARVLAGHDGQVNAVAFGPAGVVTGGYDGTIRLWRDDGSAEVMRLGPPVNAVVVAGDGEIAAGGADGVLRLVHPDGAVRSLAVDSTPLSGVALSVDGRSLAVVSLGGAAVVVERATLAVRTVFLGTERPLWAVAWDGDAVVTGGVGRVVRRWDSRSGRQIGVYGVAGQETALTAGDRGAQVFRACAACHSLSDDGVARAGPSLHGVFGRRVGSLPG